jgi:hypothetical protein
LKLEKFSYLQPWYRHHRCHKLFLCRLTSQFSQLGPEINMWISDFWIKWGSDYRTSPNFKWLITVCVTNGWAIGPPFYFPTSVVASKDGSDKWSELKTGFWMVEPCWHNRQGIWIPGHSK